jgi:hypothetical protein
MRTAVKLAIEYRLQNPDEWDEKEVTFQIRHRTVEFKEVRRYFRRKNILDPFIWFLSLPPESYLASEHVQLIPRGEFILPSTDHTHHSPQTITSEAEQDDQESQSYNMQMGFPSPTHSPIPRVLSPPTRFRIQEELIWSAGVYCAHFVESASHASLREPAVHMDTLHGRYGAKMQEGIFCASQKDFIQASKRFDSAYELLQDIFRAQSPMAFAQIFTILCELTAKSQRASTSQLTREQSEFLSKINSMTFKLLSDLASVVLHNTHPLIKYLEALQKSEDLLESLVESVHKMADVFIQDQTAWKGLYLLERYCDCLYYSGISGERQAQRARLLQLQEARYGKTRGNVLWTLTNVADDYLENCDFKKAEVAYRDAIERADYGLGGYAKAKIRFAAFEGLARIASARGKALEDIANHRQSGLGFTFGLQPHTSSLRLNGLREALSCLRLAEDEALTRADFSERRLAIVRLSQNAVQEKIREIETGTF